MMKRIRESTVEYIFKVQVDVRPQGIMRPPQDGTQYKNEAQKVQPNFGKSRDNKKIKASDINKIGRNDPCPCGSGKKYKKCCGK